MYQERSPPPASPSFRPFTATAPETKHRGRGQVSTSTPPPHHPSENPTPWLPPDSREKSEPSNHTVWLSFAFGFRSESRGSPGSEGIKSGRNIDANGGRGACPAPAPGQNPRNPPRRAATAEPADDTLRSPCGSRTVGRRALSLRLAGAVPLFMTPGLWLK